jgi:hypothetical protein
MKNTLKLIACIIFGCIDSCAAYFGLEALMGTPLHNLAIAISVVITGMVIGVIIKGFNNRKKMNEIIKQFEMESK